MSIDPAHGGRDRGCQGPNGTNEKDVNLALGTRSWPRCSRMPGRRCSSSARATSTCHSTNGRKRPTCGSRTSTSVSITPMRPTRRPRGPPPTTSPTRSIFPRRASGWRATSWTLSAESWAGPTSSKHGRNYACLREVKPLAVMVEPGFLSNPEEGPAAGRPDDHRPGGQGHPARHRGLSGPGCSAAAGSAGWRSRPGEWYSDAEFPEERLRALLRPGKTIREAPTLPATSSGIGRRLIPFFLACACHRARRRQVSHGRRLPRSTKPRARPTLCASRSTNWTPRWRRPSRSTTRPTPNWRRPRRPHRRTSRSSTAVEADLEEARARLTDRVVEIYKEGHLGVLDTLVGSASFSDLINRLNLMERLSKQDSELVAQVTAYQEEVTTAQGRTGQADRGPGALHRRGGGCRAEGRESARRQGEGSQGQGSPDSPTREGRGGAPGGTGGRGEEGRRGGAEGARGRRGCGGGQGDHHDHRRATTTTQSTTGGDTDTTERSTTTTKRTTTTKHTTTTDDAHDDHDRRAVFGRDQR